MLLGPEDPPPVEFVPGAAGAELLFVCDHAARRVPRALGDLGLAQPEFDRHIAWDVGAADVARRLASGFAAPLVLSASAQYGTSLHRSPTPAEIDAQLPNGLLLIQENVLSLPEFFTNG